MLKSFAAALLAATVIAAPALAASGTAAPASGGQSTVAGSNAPASVKKVKKARTHAVKHVKRSDSAKAMHQSKHVKSVKRTKRIHTSTRAVAPATAMPAARTGTN